MQKTGCGGDKGLLTGRPCGSKSQRLYFQPRGGLMMVKTQEELGLQQICALSCHG